MRSARRMIRGTSVCVWVLLGACGDTTATTAGNTEGGSEGSASSSASTGNTSTPTSTSAASEGSMSASETMSATSSAPTTTVDPTSGPGTTEASGSSGGTSTGGVDPSGTSTTEGVSGSSSGGDTGGDTTGEPPPPPPPGACDGDNNYTLNAHFDKGTLNNVNHNPPNGDQLQITVDGVSLPKPYMFLAHTYDGLMLKLDTATGKQLARYDSTLLKDCPSCPVNKTSWYPSRVIVDFDGNVYVANRAFGVQGALTKIAGDLGSCVDRNGNGTIETSEDANGDGIINHNDPAEFKGQNDECILWSLPVAEPNALLRALTLDGKGNAYVGTYNTKKGYKIDITSTPPKITATFNLPSTAYGFVARGDYLYSSALGQPVMRINLANNYAATTMNAPGNYGIAVDQNGIAWFGGSGLQRCDFEIGGNCQSKGGGGMSGVAVDAEGQVWACSGSTVYKYANDGTLLGTAAVPSAYGISIGHDGDPRVISYDAAYRIEGGKGGMPPGPVTAYNTGYFGGAKPFNYTYSDFTGFGALNVTVRKGEWTVVHDGVQAGTFWSQIAWNQEKEGKVPAGTSLTFQVRAADVKADLALQPWTLVEGGLIKDGVSGRFIEVRARMLIEDEMLDESPVLSDVCILSDQ